MKIEIDLNNLGFDYDEDGDRGRVNTIQEAIVTAAANQIIGTSGWEYRTQLSAAVREEARAAIAAKLDEALKGNIQRMTEWGEAIGGPVTLLDIVREELGKFLNGKATSRDRIDRPQNLVELVNVAVAQIVRTELGDDIQRVRRQVIEDLKAKTIKGVADALVSGR